mgnify:CR=1 FL=1
MNMGSDKFEKLSEDENTNITIMYKEINDESINGIGVPLINNGNITRNSSDIVQNQFLNLNHSNSSMVSADIIIRK